MTEILVLIIGLVLLSDGSEIEHTLNNKSISKGLNEKINKPQDKTQKWTIINKNGTWVFANKKPKTKGKKKANKKEAGQKPSGFITFPDGSKIEKGL